MRISVTHSTVYRYDYPVYLEPHTFRLRAGRIRTCTPRPKSICLAPAGAGTTLLAVSPCPEHTLR